MFSDVDVDAVVADLERHGLAQGLVLPSAIVGRITDYAHSVECYGDRDLECGFLYSNQDEMRRRHPRFFRTATYVNTRAHCATIRALADDAKLLEIAARYLRCRRPALQSANLTWSFPVEATERERSLAAQVFHFDRDDYRFLKFFFYLTDVGHGDGPHVCVKGTHRHKRLRDRVRPQRRSDEYVSATYGPEDLVTILGPAGSGFAEDTACFHKGMPPTTGDRLVFQLAFALTDYGVLHDAPANMQPVREVI